MQYFSLKHYFTIAVLCHQCLESTKKVKGSIAFLILQYMNRLF